MEILGIQFAPLNVPMQRRLQTLAAATWFTTLAFGGFVGTGLAIYLLVYTRFWWLTALYLTWMILLDNDVAKKGGRRSKFVRSMAWWRYLKDYFPLKLVKLEDAKLDPSRNYLFCSFPHGMLSTGAFNAFGTEIGGFGEMFPHHEPYVVTLTQHYHMPFFRDFALGLGGIAASAESIDYVLRQPGGGRVVVLMVGGAAEAYYCKPGQYTLILKNRKGFVKLAIKNGTPLVPVLSFGETDLFTQLGSPEGGLLHMIQEWLRKYLGMAPIIPIGRGFFQYSFGIIPQRRSVTTVGTFGCIYFFINNK